MYLLIIRWDGKMNFLNPKGKQKTNKEEDKNSKLQIPINN